MDTKFWRVMWILLTVDLLVSIWISFDRYQLRQTNAALVEKLKVIERPAGPVNCPSPEWFTGRKDAQ